MALEVYYIKVSYRSSTDVCIDRIVMMSTHLPACEVESKLTEYLSCEGYEGDFQWDYYHVDLLN